MRRALLCAAVTIVHAVNGPGSVGAQPPLAPASRVGAQVCNGYNPDTGSWGDIGTYYDGESFCARGYALMSFGYYGGTAPTPAAVRVNGSCCPLPAGALTDEHSFALDECPEDHVGTGTRADGAAGVAGGGQQFLRCTKVDTSRYALGRRGSGRRMGLEIEYLTKLQDLLLMRPSSRVPRPAVPVSLRYGLLRKSFAEWYYNGCVGEPFGSLLVGKRTKRCDGVVFRELVERATGEPVVVLPPCERVDDPLAPVTRCVE